MVALFCSPSMLLLFANEMEHAHLHTICPNQYVYIAKVRNIIIVYMEFLQGECVVGYEQLATLFFRPFSLSS